MKSDQTSFELEWRMSIKNKKTNQLNILSQPSIIELPENENDDEGWRLKI